MVSCAAGGPGDEQEPGQQWNVQKEARCDVRQEAWCHVQQEALEMSRSLGSSGMCRRRHGVMCSKQLSSREALGDVQQWRQCNVQQRCRVLCSREHRVMCNRRKRVMCSSGMCSREALGDVQRGQRNVQQAAGGSVQQMAQGDSVQQTSTG
ncbi:hypothetical protein NDU88_002973 [Pleurodeles waltl]|uniref:Uncharacterized protein n=1 Tax=Pleurodeles waltl TaxID=8319 RepID=A0AAV7UB89_PLEWA|nr:hypothetical protein NDU88_002973 [Pleurodeles waltl]